MKKDKQPTKELRVMMPLKAFTDLREIMEEMSLPSQAAALATAVYTLHKKVFPPYKNAARPRQADPLAEKKNICQALGGTIEDDHCKWFNYDRQNKIPQKVSLRAMNSEYLRAQFLPDKETAIRFNPHLAHLKPKEETQQ